MPHHHTHGQVRNLRTAFILNFGFTILEIVGGIWTNSVAILSDAVHDLGDSISLGLAWRFERVAQKAHDQRFSYGYQRFSLLSALLNTLILLLGSIVVLIEAIPRFLQPEPANAPGMVC
jgi:cobalt-zinc-cadmium efflux system protein